MRLREGFRRLVHYKTFATGEHSSRGQGDPFGSHLARSTLSSWLERLQAALLTLSRRSFDHLVGMRRLQLQLLAPDQAALFCGYASRSSSLSPNRHASMRRSRRDRIMVVCISWRKGTGLTQTLHSCIDNGGRGFTNGEIGEGADAIKSKIRGHNSNRQ
jgi:hypothetical protein